MIKINGKEIEFTKFPNNETLVDTKYLNTLKNTKYNNIIFGYREDSDILKLIFVLDHLMSINSGVNNIVINYMPYSRMDRSQNGSCFTLRYITSLLLKYSIFNVVYIVEPHSTVSLAGGEFKPIYITPELCKIVIDKHADIHADIDTICFPDKGAKERYTKLFEESYPELNKLNIVHCEKKRDFDTGNIIGLELVGNIDNAKNVLIADDLCSKGGTFYHTANKLKEAGVENVFLTVTHMEENVLNGELVKDTSPICKIYTTNSMGNFEFPENIIEVIPLDSIEKYKQKGVYTREELLSSAKELM